MKLSTRTRDALARAVRRLRPRRRSGWSSNDDRRRAQSSLHGQQGPFYPGAG